MLHKDTRVILYDNHIPRQYIEQVYEIQQIIQISTSIQYTTPETCSGEQESSVISTCFSIFVQQAMASYNYFGTHQAPCKMMGQAI